MCPVSDSHLITGSHTTLCIPPSALSFTGLPMAPIEFRYNAYQVIHVVTS